MVLSGVLYVKSSWLSRQTHSLRLLMPCETRSAQCVSRLAAPSVCHNKHSTPASAAHKWPPALLPQSKPYESLYFRLYRCCRSTQPWNATKWWRSASSTCRSCWTSFFRCVVHQHSSISGRAQSSGRLHIRVLNRSCVRPLHLSHASHSFFFASNSARSSGRTMSSSRSVEMARKLLSVPIWISSKSRRWK